MKFVMLDKITPTNNGCTFAYISETSWPSREHIPADSIAKRVSQVIAAQPDILVTTQEIYELTKEACPLTTFILDEHPYLKFCDLYGRYHSEPTAYMVEGSWIYDNCTIGKDTVLEPGSVIGGSSVGCEMVNGKLVRRKQFGGVAIGNNCYISPNCSIERGAFENTVISDNCCIDSGVKISHNCKIGNNVVILGNTTLAGHVTVEDNAYIACNCYIHRGVVIGSGSIIGAGSVIRKNVESKAVVVGNPPRIL